MNGRGGRASDGVFAALAGADAHRFLDRDHEDLPVADATGLGALLNGVDHVTQRYLQSGRSITVDGLGTLSPDGVWTWAWANPGAWG